MKLSNLKAKKAQSGFTLVELIIVIVVIGILAAIILVAYAGVTNRASNSADNANADQIVKVAETMNADGGSYPTTVSTLTNGDSTSKLPSGVMVVLTSTVPTEAQTETTLPTNSPKKTYSVMFCSATGGLNVYYPIRGNATAGVLSAGAGC